MKIQGKQLADQLRNEDTPFTALYATEYRDGALTFKAKNASGSSIAQGVPVAINGVSGDVPTVIPADASTSAMPAFGLTAASVNNNAEVQIITFGNLSNVATNTFSAGSTLYVNDGGGLSATAPTGSGSKIQNIGRVVRSHADSGVIKVGGAGRTNATPNLDEGYFFVGDANNQSIESAYQLPLTVGTSGQVLTSNGTDVTFQDASSGGMTVETKTANFSASSGFFYIAETTSGQTIQATVPNSGYAKGDRIKIFNTGEGIIKIQETNSPTTLDPIDTSGPVFGSSRTLNSKCLVELVATSTTAWKYVIIPQLELDSSSLSRDGETFVYDLSEKAMKPLNYTLPSAVAADDSKVLTYDHSNTEMVFSSIPEIKSPYLEVTTSTPSLDTSTHYLVPRSTSLTSITMALTLASASGASDLNGLVFEIVNNSSVVFTLSVTDRRDSTFTYYTDIYLDNVAEAPFDGAYTVDLPAQSVHRISVQYRPVGNDFYLDYNILTLT
jgi:hypothetical protein